MRIGIRTGKTMKSRSLFLAKAKSLIGIHGRPNVATRWYANQVAKDKAFLTAPWCDMFMSYVAHGTGLSKVVGTFAYCPSHVKWFKDNGRWGKTPKVGALVFYDWNRDGEADHVGVVESFRGNTIIAIEGNKGDAAVRVERSSGMLGYGYPKYPGDAVPSTYVVKKGDSLSLIAFQFYSDYSKWRDIYKLNKKAIGPNPGIIKPGLRLTLPRA